MPKEISEQELREAVESHQAAMLMLFQLAIECSSKRGRRKLVNARAAIQADFSEWMDSLGGWED